MALGTCRHCDAERIPTDAPVCRHCGGWRPNPGWFTRMGVVMTRVVAAFFLVVGLVLCAGMAWLALAAPNGQALLVYLAPVAFFVLGSGSMLLRSLIRPYGREASAE